MGSGRGWGGVEDLERPLVPTRVAAGVASAHFGLWTWCCGASLGGLALCDVPVPQIGASVRHRDHTKPAASPRGTAQKSNFWLGKAPFFTKSREDPRP